MQTTVRITHSVAIGEGALERIFANIEKVDPRMERFSVCLVGFADRGRTSHRLKSLELDLPPPRSPNEAIESNDPPTIGYYSGNRRHEIGFVLESLHDEELRIASDRPYAVLVFYQPTRAMSGATAIPFPRAPGVTSCCLLAVTGNLLGFLPPREAVEYLQLCRHLVPPALHRARGLEVESILPYLRQPARYTDSRRADDLHLGLNFGGNETGARNPWIARVMAERGRPSLEPRQALHGILADPPP